MPDTNYVSIITRTVFLSYYHKPSPARFIGESHVSPDIARLPLASQRVAREAGLFPGSGG